MKKESNPPPPERATRPPAPPAPPSKRVSGHERVVSARDWISVNDRLPTHIYSVLAYVVDGGFASHGEPMTDIVAYNPETGEWLQNVGDAGDEIVTVTHWMDLPDDPAH